MSTVTLDSIHAPDSGQGSHGHAASFLSTYVFSKDHKVIGIQFLFSTLIWFLVGGLLALGRALANRVALVAGADVRQCFCRPKGGRCRPKLTRCSSRCTRR